MQLVYSGAAKLKILLCLYFHIFILDTKDGSMVRLNFCKEIRYAFFVMVQVRYAFFVMVRVRYVGTWFELKIPDFLHIAPAFCMQRKKTAKAEVKCVH